MITEYINVNDLAFNSEDVKCIVKVEKQLKGNPLKECVPITQLRAKSLPLD